MSRFLVIAWVVGPLGWLSGCPGVQSYKLSETPINLTNSDNPTDAEKAGPCDTPKSTPSSGAFAC